MFGRLSSLALSFVLCTPAAGQLPGIVDYSPTPPAEATWPRFVDVAATSGTAGATLADPGAGRGTAWVDIVGRDPADPGNLDRVGPPDGILDLVVVNSNTPALPLGAAKPVTPGVGTVHTPTSIYRGEPDGKYTYVTHLMGVTAQGFDIAYPGGSPWGVVPGDYDGDGDVDLFFPCGGFNLESPNALLRNDGGVFTNVSAAAGIVEEQVSFSAAWIDYDRDGDLDLYVANSIAHPGPWFLGSWSGDPTDRLYRNEGDGTFTEVAEQAGVALKSTGFSVTTSDLDNDGWCDLVVSCYSQWNKVFYNDGDGTFSLMAPEGHPEVNLNIATALVPDPTLPGAYEFKIVPSPKLLEHFPANGLRSMSVEVVDVNADGWTDIVYGVFSSQLDDGNRAGALGALYSPAERHYLYLNLGDRTGDGKGDGYWREVGDEVGFDHVAGTMGLITADFDANGYPDVYAGNGGPRVLFQLEEDLLFTNLASAWPRDFQRDPTRPLSRALWEIGALAGAYENTFMAHGMAATNDGPGSPVGLIVSNGGPGTFNLGQTNVVFANTGRSDGRRTRSLAVDLEVGRSAPHAIGTRVEVLRSDDAGNVSVGVQEQRGNLGFASANFGPLIFGLDRDEPVYASATWASGVRQGALLLGRRSNGLSLAEPELSLEVGRNGNRLRVTLTNHGANPLQGDLVREVLRPIGSRTQTGAPSPGKGGAGGAQAGWVGAPHGSTWTGAPRELHAAGVVVDPGASWTLVVPTDERDQVALHRFLLVDPGGATLAENAKWLERRLVSSPEHALVPQLELPGGVWTGDESVSTTTPSAARSVFLALHDVVLEAGTVLHTIYPGGGPLQLEEGTTTILDAELVRTGDQVVLTLDEPATIHFEPEAAVVTLGAPAVCCEQLPSGDTHVLRFLDVSGWVQVDGRRYSTSGERVDD